MHPLSPLLSPGFCKQQLWPLFHYILPVSPSSSGRFDSDLWQAYVKANKVGWGGAGPVLDAVLCMTSQPCVQYVALRLSMSLCSAHFLQCFADKVVEESASDTDFVWIHDYHLLVRLCITS